MIIRHGIQCRFECSTRHGCITKWVASTHDSESNHRTAKPRGTICCPRLYFAGSSTLALAWRQSLWLQTRCTLVWRLESMRLVGWSYGVMVSTLDSESSDPGSNPGRTLQCAAPCGSELLSFVEWPFGEVEVVYCYIHRIISKRKPGCI